MKILITLGATREPIDAVRFIGNRSSGKMGAALGHAAKSRKHQITLIAGSITVPLPNLESPDRRLDVQTAEQMYEAVVREFHGHDLLFMAAAVADYRPIRTEPGKLPRSGGLTIICEPTKDILAAVSPAKRPDQRVVGFSLEQEGDIDRARDKMIAKKVDLMVFNPLGTMNSENIDATLLWPNGRAESLGPRSKGEMGQTLLSRAEALFGHS
ncbi:MAG TPA: phosphopantothenoylcysteine decarboxylase [Tepidisphaeraceae bacterium]|jgi:phosphopantothenoylcysteine decarboxylase/phosphopantothenate--cysteine ligase|nr:phosphopantothenoylcysteine decarboxylase [Tepidisphaeraceae bacterium]